MEVVVLIRLSNGRTVVGILLVLAFLCIGGGAFAEGSYTVGVTYVKAPLNVPSIIERKLGIIDRAMEALKLKVEYPEITAGPDQTRAMAAGSVQVAHCLGGTSALLAASEGVDLKIVGIYSRAPRAFTILVKKDSPIRDVKDLKGRKVAGPKGTVLHQLLSAALEREGLELSDVQFVPMGIPEAVAALSSGAVDAALAAGPAVRLATQRGARVLTDGRGLVDGITVIAMSGRFLAEHPEAVRAFMRAHREALQLMKQDRLRAVELTAQETGLSQGDVISMMSLYDFDPSVRPEDLKELEKTQNFLIRNRMMRKRVDLGRLVRPL
ncbi:NrtA/SsuA/CpmA family ABC transporter substrate-binding protein [Thermanaerovibrio velox]|nr:NrtA/SsuA/CpmA family ABC transporter substrate-binding protein [Thermanaerovibrio velox]